MKTLRIAPSLPDASTPSRMIEQRPLLFGGQAGQQFVDLLAAGFQLFPGGLLIGAKVVLESDAIRSSRTRLSGVTR